MSDELLVAGQHVDDVGVGGEGADNLGVAEGCSLVRVWFPFVHISLLAGRKIANFCFLSLAFTSVCLLTSLYWNVIFKRTQNHNSLDFLFAFSFGVRFLILTKSPESELKSD